MAGATGTMLLRTLLALSIAAACTGSGAIHKGKYTISKATFRRDLFLTNSPERSYVQLGVFGYGDLGTCKITVTDTSEPRLKPELLTGIASTATPGIGFALFRINGSVVDLTHYPNLCSSNYTMQDGKRVFTDVLDRETLHDTLRVRLSRTSPLAGTTTDAPPATPPPSTGPPPSTSPPPSTDTPPTGPECAAQHEEVLCTALKGCDWNEDGRKCTVSQPIDCSMAGDENACNTIAALGCKWAGAEGASKTCVADGGAARRADALEVAAEAPEVATYSGQVRITVPGHWALVFYKCGMKVTSDTNLKVVITEKNGDSFLQVGDAILPQFYVSLSLVFFVLLLKWAHWMKENKMHLHKIHFLMALTLVLKSAALLFEGLRYYYYRDHGDMSPLYDTMYYMFTIFKGTLVFSLVVLIGSGWSFLKPHLADRDKKVLMCVIPLQLSMSIVSIIIDEYSSGRPEVELLKLQVSFWSPPPLVLCFVHATSKRTIPKHRIFWPACRSSAASLSSPPSCGPSSSCAARLLPTARLRETLRG